MQCRYGIRLATARLYRGLAPDCSLERPGANLRSFGSWCGVVKLVLNSSEGED
jgi:hypothetical protein